MTKKMFPNRAVKFTALLFSLLFLTLQTNNVKGQARVFVTLNPGNCPNCSINLYQIEKAIAPQKINLIIEERFEGEKEEVNELLDLAHHPGMEVIYSDSAYSKLSKNSLFPEAIVVNQSDEEIYRSTLIKMNQNELSELFHSNRQDAGIIENWCLPNIKEKGINFTHISNDLIIMEGQLKNFYFFKLNDHDATQVKLKPADYEEMYKAFYRDQFSSKFPIMKETYEVAPMWKPNVDGVINVNGNIYIQINLRDWEYDENLKDTAVFSESILGHWDEQTKQIIKYYRMSNSLDSFIFSPSDYYSVNGHLVGYYSEKKSGKPGAGIFSIDEKNSTITLTKIVDFKTPKVYEKKKLIQGTTKNITVGNNAMVFDYSDSIYLVKQNKNVAIPFSDQDIANYYTIRAVYSNGSAHAVVFFDKNSNFTYLHFDEKGVRRRVEIGNGDTYYNGRLYNLNTYVYKDLQDGCYKIQRF